MRVAIVDAYSTGRFLAAEMRRRGLECVHVQSGAEIIPAYRAGFRPDDFSRNIVAEDGAAFQVAAELTALGVRHLIAGAETGVELAESLTAMLGLPGNDPARPRARRDKAAMAWHLRRRGLDAPAGLRTADRAAAVAWARRHGRWPVVIKPVASAASDHVTFCFDPDGLEAAFDRIMARDNLLGRPNEAVIVQELLAGDEFVVNAVSRAGRHHVAEVWRYVKRPVSGSVAYDYEEPLPADDPRAGSLGEYVRRALDALGVWNGPSHSEVILTERGPVLLETGARLPGMVLPQVMVEHFGVSQVELAVRAIADPAGFDRVIGSPYRTHGHLRNVFLLSDRDGVLADDAQFALLRELATFAGMAVSARAGGEVRRTGDLFSSPGHVYLRSDEPEAIVADYERIRALERTTLYPLSPLASLGGGNGGEVARQRRRGGR